MATYVDPNDPTQKKLQQPAAAGDPSLAPLSSFNVPQAKSQPSNTSGQFMSYDRLLGANQGVGQNEANQLTSNANQLVGQAQTSLNNASNTFTNAVQNGQAGWNWGQTQAPPSSTPLSGADAYYTLANSKANPGVVGGSGDFTASTNAGAGAAPSVYQPLIDTLNQKIGSAAYTGPTNTNGYFDDAANKAAAASAQLQGLGSVAGRQSQLGGSLLDALLAGSQGGAQLTSAAQNAGALSSALNKATGTAQGQATDAQARLGQYQAALKGQLANATDQQNQAQANQQNLAQTQQNNADLNAQYLRMTHGAENSKLMTEGEFAQLTPEERQFLAAGGALPGEFQGSLSAMQQQVQNHLKQIRGNK